MRTIDLVYVNAGSGHRSAALALEAVIREVGLPWRVRLVDLFAVLDPQDVFRKSTGMGPEGPYNMRLARGWTAGLAQELKILQGLIRLGHQPLTRLLRRHWLETRPDMVVSLVPNLNRAMFEALRAVAPAAPYVTILTDLADFPPSFWIERDQPQHLICGSAKAVEQARAQGYPEQRIHEVSGMIIRPEFYVPVIADRDFERRSIGLDPLRPTGLIMFGGYGSRVMRGIAKQLDDARGSMTMGWTGSFAKLEAVLG